MGIDTGIKLEQLFQTIAYSGKGVTYPLNVKNIIAPIVCKNPMDQNRFHQLYDVWVRSRTYKDSVQQKAKHESIETKTPSVDHTSTKNLEDYPIKKWGWSLFITILSTLLTVAIFAFFIMNQLFSGSSGDITDATLSSPLAVRILFPLLIFLIPLLYEWIKNRQIKALQRRFTFRPLQSKGVTLETANQFFFRGTGIEHSLQLLRQHRVVDRYRFDIPQTLKKMIQSAGFVRFCMQERKVSPEHLLLVDRYCTEDHIRGLADLLERRFKEANASVTRFEFRQDPRSLQRRNYATGVLEKKVRLKDLTECYHRSRLIILTQGSGLINSVTGQLKPWLLDLNIWKCKAVLTPKPKSIWDDVELNLQQNGFVVSQATSNALGVIAEHFRDMEGSDAFTEGATIIHETMDTYPSMIEEQPSRWLEDHVPNDEERTALVDQLRHFLGSKVFYWCCACAVFPKIHSELTFHLGGALADSQKKIFFYENEFLSLSRLPWFQHGFMPDWLRLTLISKLTPAQKKIVRSALTEVLLTAKTEEQKGLILNISDKTTTLVADFIRKVIPSKDRTNPLREEIFLSFISKRKLPSLAVEAPSSLVWTICNKFGATRCILWGTAVVFFGFLFWMDPWPTILLVVIGVGLYLLKAVVKYLKKCIIKEIEEWIIAGLTTPYK